MANAFLAGRSTLLKGDSVAFEQDAVRIPVGAIRPKGRPETAASAQAQSEVELVRAKDGTIEAIIVHCTCGREITLRCEYLEGGAENAQKSP